MLIAWMFSEMPFHPGQQGAHAPYDQPDLHARLARLVQLHHQLLVDEAVALERHGSAVAGLCVLDFVLDQLLQAASGGLG